MQENNNVKNNQQENNASENPAAEAVPATPWSLRKKLTVTGVSIAGLYGLFSLCPEGFSDAVKMTVRDALMDKVKEKAEAWMSNFATPKR